MGDAVLDSWDSGGVLVAFGGNDRDTTNVESATLDLFAKHAIGRDRLIPDVRRRELS